ncbi:MAG: HDOD domain-containing protein, partial [Proteobacteria bacterium]|nr:HDOD domain-containing protein [Pseudomonadota bacterium]
MPEKANVLFVDDEARVLDGFRRVLREKRGEWRLFFAHSGRQALEILDVNPMDVIVCDMRMPEMDGAQVLEYARERQPGASRICLSGHSEKEAMLKASSVAHLYLSKPCAREVLVSTVERNIGYKALLPDRGLRAMASRIEFLPPRPTVMAAIMREMAQDAPRLARVADLIHQDPALTVKILQLANSEYWGIAREVGDARQAAALLGLDVLSPILDAVMEKNPASVWGRHPRMFEDLYRHGMHVALAASRIAQREDPSDLLVSRAFTCGLIHDVGKLVLAAHAPDDYNYALELARKRNISVQVVERDVFSGTHQEAGAFFL